MEDRSEQLLKRLLKEEVKRINLHLPKSAKSLSELLREDEPKVEAIDGSLIIMRKNELAELARIVPEEYHQRFMLPIIVLRRMNLGKGTFTPLGGKVENFTIKRVLGLTSLAFEKMDQNCEPCYLYRPHVQELLRRFKSLVIIGFGVPEELQL